LFRFIPNSALGYKNRDRNYREIILSKAFIGKTSNIWPIIIHFTIFVGAKVVISKLKILSPSCLQEGRDLILDFLFAFCSKAIVMPTIY